MTWRPLTEQTMPPIRHSCLVRFRNGVIAQAYRDGRFWQYANVDPDKKMRVKVCPLSGHYGPIEWCELPS